MNRYKMQLNGILHWQNMGSDPLLCEGHVKIKEVSHV